MTGARNFGLLTLKKQAVVGTPETAATGGYSFPIVDGGLSPDTDTGDLPRQGSSMQRLGRFVQRHPIQGTVSVLCNPEGLGMLLIGAMGSELALGTPAGGITPHTFVMADTWLFPMTVWDSRASGSDADVWRYSDAYITRLQIAGSSGENFIAELEIVAQDFTKTAAGAAGWPTGYNDAAVLQGADPRFKFIESQIKLSPDDNTPDLYDNVEDITFEINRDPALRYGSKLTPTVISADRLVNLSVGITYDNAQGAWQWLEETFLEGGAYGGAPSQDMPLGSLDITAGVHPSGNASTLRIVSGGGTTLPGTVAIQQNFEYVADRPDASGEPDIIEQTLDGQLVAPTVGTTEVTVILGSARATLYSA